jgi:hypothetical protein
MGAKSSSIYVETPDIKLLIDPGVAELQPSYPMSKSDKRKNYLKAYAWIFEAARMADTIFISHYHYDHHTLPQKRIRGKPAKAIYEGKKLWIKDPNTFINMSQHGRARLFLQQLLREDFNLEPPHRPNLSDPVDQLRFAKRKDYGDYTKRREELLKAGAKWYNKLVQMWKESPWVGESQHRGISFVDGKSLRIGSTYIGFSPPMFHGLEYDRIGWTIGLTIVVRGKKFIYSSDLQGPVIEDYTEWLIKEDPDILVLDGPPTYLAGFLVNRINLQRVIDNVTRIIEHTKSRVIIYDHHLPRDIRYREKMASVYKTADIRGRVFITASEWLGSERPSLREYVKGGQP